MARLVLSDQDRRYLAQIAATARNKQAEAAQATRDRDDAARIAMVEDGAGVGEIANVMDLSRTSIERIRAGK